MLTNEVTLNIYLLVTVLGFSVLAGFAFRAGIIMRYRTKIQELERELLNSHQQVLELEHETLSMESQMQDIKSPVITMKAPSIEVEVSKKVPDISLRKQLLSKKNIDQQSASGL
jgi:hypothetical protein